MNFALRKEAVLGQSTTNSRINPTAPLYYEFGLFQLLSKKFFKANPSGAKEKVFFFETQLQGKQKLILKKFALPVTAHLMSLFTSIEQFLHIGANCKQTHQNETLPINALISSFSIPIDCFFASDETFVASLDVYPRDKKALISIQNRIGHEIYQISETTPFTLIQIKGDLGYCPPPLVCPVSPPSSSTARQLTESEVEQLNQRITLENQQKIESVRTKLQSVPAPNLPGKPNVSSERNAPDRACNSSTHDTSHAILVDSDYKVERHWV